MSIEQSTKLDELKLMAQQRGVGSQPEWAELNDLKATEPAQTVSNGSVQLQNMAELSYSVPPNTTLLRVLGPISHDEDWNRTANCYAALDPEPSWWKAGNLPLSTSYKPQYAANRTLFLLPLDPTVAFTLRVGPPNPASKCFVSGFQSYPFH